MIKQLEIENFKCFGPKVSIPLAPITLIYGENSSGKSTILQAVTLLKNALTGWKSDWNREKQNKAIPFSNRHDGAPSDIEELTHDGNPDKQISVSFQRDENAVSISFGRKQGEVSISSQGHMLASVKWEGSEHKWKYGWMLMGELVRRAYNELLKRKADVVEGYKRLIEYETINSYLCSRSDYLTGDVGAEILQSLHPIRLTPVDCPQLPDSPPEKSWETILLESKREGLPDWVRNGFPGYTKYVKTSDYKQRYKRFEQIYSQAIAAYSKDDFSFDEFCKLHFPSDWKILGKSQAACLSLDNAIIAALVPDLAGNTDNSIKHSDEDFSSGILLELKPTKPMWSDSQLTDDYSDLADHWATRSRRCGARLFTQEAKKVLGSMDDMIRDIHSLPAVREPPKDSYSEAKANPIFEPAIKSRINDWLERFEVGYTIDVGLDGSLRFLDKRRASNHAAKITEVGFGFSQLLPIIGHCYRTKPSVITVEQPELHIHPRLQAELGSLFKDAYQNHDHQIIAETHSEHLMLRIQKLIRKKELKTKDVCVLYVSRDTDGSRVQQLRLDDDGSFIDRWPAGFFPERFNEIME